MKKEYKVRHRLDNTYEVIKIDTDDEYFQIEPVFKGNIAECEAYIRLIEGGYM
jgi:hypothetical protein